MWPSSDLADCRATKMTRHLDIRMTFNICSDVMTDEMATAENRIAQLAFSALSLCATVGVRERF
jgi:hypothetical protein